MYKYITSYFVRKKYPSRVLITIEKDFYFFSTTLHFIEIFRNGIFIYTTLFVRILIKHNFKLLPTKSIFLRRLSHFIFRARRAFLLTSIIYSDFQFRAHCFSNHAWDTKHERSGGARARVCTVSDATARSQSLLLRAAAHEITRNARLNTRHAYLCSRSL